MTKLVTDETAVTAMYVFETVQAFLENKSQDHPIHSWRSTMGMTSVRYHCVSMAERIDALYALFENDELDATLFEEDFVPMMLDFMDFASSDENTAPNFKGGMDAAVAHVKTELDLENEQAPTM